MRRSFKRMMRNGLLSSAMIASAGAAGSLAWVAPASAQSFSSFSATGTVVDADSKPIAGATVTIRSDDQGFTRTARTSASGAFSIPELRQGSYTFTVSADGFEVYAESGVRLALNNSANQFRLIPAGSSPEAASGGSGDIVVRGQRTRSSEFDLTTVGAVINVAEISARIPVARNVQALIQLAPGTQAGSGAFGNLSSFNGSAVSENAFYLNGLNITDFRKGLAPVEVPYDFYQTLEVKTGGYAAEFGRATGGFVSATTKSGSNDFHGGVLFTWNPDELRSYGPDTFGSDNDGGKSEARSTIFQLSGPIIKDHLFFYGLYQARDNTSRTAGRQFLGNPQVQSQVDDPAQYLGTSRSYYTTRSPFYAAKVDLVITDGQRLEGTYFSTKGTSFTNVFGDTASASRRYNYITNTDGPFSSRSTSRFGGNNYVGRYTGVWTDWLTTSAAYGRNENISQTQYFNASGLDIAGVQDARDPQNIRTLVVGGGFIDSSRDIRKFYRGDVDLRFALLGSHHVKFGYDNEDLLSQSQYQPGGDGRSYTLLTARAGNIYGLAPGTTYVQEGTYRQQGSFTSRNEAYYIQDSWSLFADRLTLNLGLRNDRFSNNNSRGETFYKSGNQWGPRLGFTLDPLGERTDKVYGSFSRMFVPVPSNTNIRQTGGETFFTRTNLFNGFAANGVPILGPAVLYPTAAACPDDGVRNCSVTGTGEPRSAEASVAQGLKPQSADEYILGYEKRLGTRWRVGAFFTYTKLNEVLEDVSIDQAVLRYCAEQRIAGCDNVFQGYNQYVLVNPGRAATITLYAPINGEATPRTIDFSAEALGYPLARRTYKGMTFEAHRDFDGAWSLDASYTYSKTVGNYEGGVKTDNGQSDTGLTTDFDAPGNTLGTYGYTPNDKRHVIKLAGSYQLFDSLNLGLNVQAYSPRRYGCIGYTPVNVDPFSGAGGLFCQIGPDGAINTNPQVTQPLQLVRRGSVFQSDWQIVNDADISYTFDIGKASMTARLSVFNLLNRKSKLNFNENGTDGQGVASPYYRTVTQYQGGRSTRLQLAFNF